MKGKLSESADGNAAVESVFRGQNPRAGSRHGGRVMLSVAVLPEVRDALHTLADRAGVSMADFIANAIAQPERLYDTAALRQAKPLSDLSYRLVRLIEALEGSDVPAALTLAREARSIVTAALLPLAKAHRSEIGSKDGRVAGGWHG